MVAIITKVSVHYGAPILFIFWTIKSIRSEITIFFTVIVFMIIVMNLLSFFILVFLSINIHMVVFPARI